MSLIRSGPLLNRVKNSPVAWSWLFNGLRLAFGLLLLPLVLTKLNETELGMYYVLLSLVAVVPLVDFGFGPTIGRFVSYAMGGAKVIQAQGVARPGNSNAPNYALLWELLFTTRALYRRLALALFLILGAWGTYVVELRIEETPSLFITRLAWAITLVGAVFDIYSNWYGVYLRSMNQVLSATRMGVISYVLRLLVSCGLLLGGGGLLSLPVGSLMGSIVLRTWTRRKCLRLLASHPAPAHAEVGRYLKILWPNSWRLGVQFVSGYLTVNANTAICLHVLGLAANAEYGLSAQLMGIAMGMAAVWTSVRWPLVGIYQARHDYAGLRRILWSRIWLQNLTYVLLALGLLLTATELLERFAPGKSVLPREWFALLLLNALLEMNFNIWGTLISTTNRLPYLWPTVATNVASLLLSLSLIHLTDLGLGALVLGPLISGSVFNYWYWPFYAARGLRTSLLRFLFQGTKAEL